MKSRRQVQVNRKRQERGRVLMIRRWRRLVTTARRNIDQLMQEVRDDAEQMSPMVARFGGWHQRERVENSLVVAAMRLSDVRVRLPSR